MARIGRDGALRKLIEAARALSLDPLKHEATTERLAWVLGKQEILVEAAGVRLSAWLSEKLWLTVSVTVSGGWNQDVEEQLYKALKRSRRITAMLVIAEWQEIRVLCEKLGGVSQHALN